MKDDNYENACSECHRVFDTATGEYAQGWETVYIVSPGPLLCKRCKESIIKTLEGAVPV